MSSRNRQLLRGGKTKSPPPASRGLLPVLLAAGAVLVIILGVLLLTNLGRGSTASNSSSTASGQPKLALDRQEIDFGKVPLDIPVTAVFRISNAGDAPLRILNEPVVEVKQGC
jgi:hypothetical protein